MLVEYKRAERGGHREAAGKHAAAGFCMAGDAVAGAGEILALAHHIGGSPGARRLGLWRLGTHRRHRAQQRGGT